MDDFLKGDKRVLNRMYAAKALSDKQIAADDIKSQLCDKIFAEKKKLPGIAEKISDLEYSDKELFGYIRRLEFVQSGIWCDACAAAKTIHHDADGSVLEGTVYPVITESPLESKSTTPTVITSSLPPRSNPTCTMPKTSFMDKIRAKNAPPNPMVPAEQSLLDRVLALEKKIADIEKNLSERPSADIPEEISEEFSEDESPWNAAIEEKYSDDTIPYGNGKYSDDSNYYMSAQVPNLRPKTFFDHYANDDALPSAETLW